MASTPTDTVLKLWGPLIALIMAVAAGASAQVRVSYLEDTVREVKSVQRTDDKEIRNALGKIQLNQAKICVAVSAKCIE